MIGQQALLEMRRAQRSPRCVWITDGEDVRARDWHDEPNLVDQKQHAVLRVEPQDIPEALDFRCCIGLEVHIAGESGEHRARQLHQALVDAGARRVITSTYAADGSVNLFLHGVANG